MAEVRQVDISQVDDTTSCVHLGGTWLLRDGLPTDKELDRDVQTASSSQRISFDTKTLAGWDSSLVTFLVGLIDGCRRRGVKIDCGGLPEGVRRLLALVEAVPEAAAQSEPLPSWLARLGNATGTAWRSMVRTLAFLGEATLAFGRLLVGRARHRRSDLFHEIQEAGAHALPIVTLIGLLIRMILAFAGGVTLRTFGATVH